MPSTLQELQQQSNAAIKKLRQSTSPPSKELDDVLSIMNARLRRLEFLETERARWPEL